MNDHLHTHKQRRSTFLQEESELSALVTKCIEAREEEVFSLQIEAEKVHQRYVCVRVCKHL